MPPVAAAAIGTAFAAAGAYAAGTYYRQFLAVNFGSIIMSGLSQALAPKPDKPDLSSFNSLKNTGYTQQFRQAITDRRVVYGEVRTSGPIVLPGRPATTNICTWLLPWRPMRSQALRNLL